MLLRCSAYRTAICRAKRGGFKDTYPDDLLAPVLRVRSVALSFLTCSVVLFVSVLFGGAVKDLENFFLCSEVGFCAGCR